MGMLYRLCIWLSVGIVLGFLGGGVKWAAKKELYGKTAQSRPKAEAEGGLWPEISHLAAAGAGVCVVRVFLILGIAAPDQAEYANNMSELIVAVLTVISIIFAFLSF